MEKNQYRALDDYMRASATPLTEIREQLYQIDRLTTLGKTALSIVHEINNALAAIQEHAGWMGDLLADEPDRNENWHRYRMSVSKIEVHVERVRKIIHHAVGFARPTDLQNSALILEEAVNEAISALGHLPGMAHIVIRTDFPPDLPKVPGDRTRLQQVFRNIVENAIDAMPNGGELNISASMVRKRIEIQLSDTGSGIPEDCIERVFEPFFSTKTKSNGTGLGLSISRDIVQEMGGDISVKSTPGRGTTFTVALPACAK